MPQKKLLLLLGGHYHDFGGFEAFVRELFGAGGFDVAATYEPGDLLDLRARDVVVLYTCHVEPPDNPDEGLQYTGGLSDEETNSLIEWVQAGGGLVAAHSATTIRPDNEALRRLIGGRFISHPPRFPFTVYPMEHQHPILEGVGTFTVVDELYTQEYANVDVHAVAVDRGIAHAMVWTRTEGSGRVVHIAPGHDASVWSEAGYGRLVRQAVDWSLGSTSS